MMLLAGSRAVVIPTGASPAEIGWSRTVGPPGIIPGCYSKVIFAVAPGAVRVAAGAIRMAPGAIRTAS